MKYIKLLFFLFFSIVVLAQETFTIKVEVIDADTKLAIKKANVQVKGKQFGYSLIDENYKVSASVGDELIVDYKGFETVFYTITSDDDIKIMVESSKNIQESEEIIKLKTNKNKERKIKSLSRLSKTRKADFYNQYLDSAKYFKKKNIDKSLSFIEKTLQENLNSNRKATSFAVLADVYLHWKQYDLAVENYKASLKESENSDVQLNLAKAQYLDKDYNASMLSYQKSLKNKLSNYQKILVNEGLGDVYITQKEYTKAKSSYDVALTLAKENLVTPKVTDLNSKIADLFAKQGSINEANKYFKNSLELADKENVKRSLKEQYKVADFYNKSRRFDEEINLRKQSLKNASNIETDNKESLVDSITSQKINYKIGSAYFEKRDYDEAIPYLEKSITDANTKEDLIVEKYATKRLSEVYASVGDYTKALETYQAYVELVDKSYTKKQQEILQVKRFGKRIAENQNRIASLEKDKELSESKINLAYIDQQLTEETNKRQKFIIYALIFGFILASIGMYLLFKLTAKQKQANNLLALKSMRSQMNPHFIFNALNSVNSFIAVNDERSANRYLSEFSTLMRSVLENSDEDFIPLSKEIELLELYVKLEHNRFKDKFEYTINIDDSIQIDSYEIPPMLLQPYIENAIWHGLRYKKEKGNLMIQMNAKNDGSIEIIIEDDGVGREKSIEMKTKNQLKQKSKGMSTIKNRIHILNTMYKDKITVNVVDAKTDGTGTKVILTLKQINR